jgi:hypothetical protein
MLSTILFSLSVIIFYNNSNIIIINTDDERLQDPILLLKIPMGTRNNFSENYRQFGHALSKRFASHGLGYQMPYVRREVIK